MAYPYYQNYPYNPMYYQPQQNVQTQSPQIQNGGFVMVKSVNEAMNYPVAPGNSVTFKNENQPYIYTKTLGFSQLDQPIFETFRLVKEEQNFNADKKEHELEVVEYFSISQGEEIKNEMSKLKIELNELKTELTELKTELGSYEKMEVVSA